MNMWPSTVVVENQCLFSGLLFRLTFDGLQPQSSPNQSKKVMPHGNAAYSVQNLTFLRRKKIACLHFDEMTDDDSCSFRIDLTCKKENHAKLRHLLENASN